MNTIKLTKRLIEKGMTDNCGITAKQFYHLGVSWPPQKGWKKKLIGTEIPLKYYNAFLKAGKNYKPKKKKRFTHYVSIHQEKPLSHIDKQLDIALSKD